MTSTCLTATAATAGLPPGSPIFASLDDDKSLRLLRPRPLDGRSVSRGRCRSASRFRHSSCACGHRSCSCCSSRCDWTRQVHTACLCDELWLTCWWLASWRPPRSRWLRRNRRVGVGQKIAWSWYGVLAPGYGLFGSLAVCGVVRWTILVCCNTGCCRWFAKERICIVRVREPPWRQCEYECRAILEWSDLRFVQRKSTGRVEVVCCHVLEAPPSRACSLAGPFWNVGMRLPGKE